MTITKTHFSDSIRKGFGLPKSRSSGLLTSLFAIMKATLANGEDMMLEARRVVTFKCSRPLKQKLNGKGETDEKWYYRLRGILRILTIRDGEAIRIKKGKLF